MSAYRPAAVLVAEIRQALAAKGPLNTLRIARETALTQSNVHRCLRGQPKRVGKTLLALCIYAKIDPAMDKLTAANNATLMHALEQVWDGSEQHARSLARLLIAASNAALPQSRPNPRHRAGAAP
ncbi:hypothetical protein HPT27_12170 [Permianibacter sp. IMCC34836]|uniref:hypothetical protein n=1 Tax=Permianibacter fluminis TaxID=2738515 RepID=UPI001555EA0B|nr:hypothetical protein [Permianibacter fluminis]NQD37783.1 hypothetical protein [Permianibacter fluminis]